MNRKLNKPYTLIILVIGLSCLVVIALSLYDFFQINDEKIDGIGNNNTFDEQSLIVEGYAFMSISYDSLEELAGHVGHIVSGTVMDRDDFNLHTDEYVFQIDEQFKGETDSEEIYIYETKGTLGMGQSYILFMSKRTGGYYPHPTYTSEFKDSILRISGEKIVHGSKYLEPDLSLEDIRQRLYTMKDQADSNYATVERGYVARESIPLEQMIEEADVIALIEPVHFFHENKYAVITDLNFHTVYRNVTSYDLPSTPGITYSLPIGTKLNTQYIAFLQIDIGMVYTLSVEGSMISREDEAEWEKVLQLLLDDGDGSE